MLRGHVLKDWNFIPANGCINGCNNQLMFKRLTDEHTIKWIAMKQWERFETCYARFV